MGRHYYPLNFLHADEGISNPWWDPNGDGLCIWAAYEPEDSPSYAVSLVDASGTGNDAIDDGGAATPTWGLGVGWTLDGVGNYLRTTFLPLPTQLQTLIIKFDSVTNGGALAGMMDAADAFGIVPDQGGSVEYDNGTWGAPGNFRVPQHLAGTLAITGLDAFRDGLPEGGLLPGWVGGPTVIPLWIGCFNDVAPHSNIAAVIRKLAIYSCYLTPSQVLAISTAM